MGLLTKEPTIEHYRLFEPFGVFPAGSIIKVVNASAWPPFKTIQAEKIDTRERPTHNFVFDAAEHARMLDVMNQPPAPPRRGSIPYDELLAHCAWSQADIDRALLLGFPRANGTSATWNTWSTARATKTSIWVIDEINLWLQRMRSFGATMPSDISTKA